MPTSTLTKTFARTTELGFLHYCPGFCQHFLDHSDTQFFLQSRRCEHHGQQHGSAGEGSTWPPWLRGCRGAAGEGGCENEGERGGLRGWKDDGARRGAMEGARSGAGATVREERGWEERVRGGDGETVRGEGEK